VILELRAEYPVRLLCRVLEVSRSGLRAWLVREPSARSRSRERLKLAVPSRAPAHPPDRWRRALAT
jgi:hypothetical protein